jgi:tripartite-type tricarboxylate transporter receptor subunit TctC
MKIPHFLVRSLCFAFSLYIAAAIGQTVAEPYPIKPIRLISPIPPGGAPDTIARILAAKLSSQLKQQVYVENKIGSNGNIAAEYVAYSKADGYTFLVGMDSLFVINPYLYAKSGLDANKDLIPIATLGANQFTLTINPNLPAKNLNEFIELAKSSNPPLAYASGGNGSQHHLTMEILMARTGIKMLHIPYKGGTPATVATITGDTAAMFSGTSNANLIRSGKLIAIATSGNKRTKTFPEVPTISETYKNFENTIWIGLFAPLATSNHILQKIRLEINKALIADDLVESFYNSGGIEPYITSIAEMKDRIKKDQEKYSQIIRSLNLTLN